MSEPAAPPSDGQEPSLHDHLATTLIGKPFAELTAAQRDVITAICEESPTIDGPSRSREPEPAFWEGLADKVAAVGGSWASSSPSAPCWRSGSSATPRSWGR